jgi:hypothetical protein
MTQLKERLFGGILIAIVAFIIIGFIFSLSFIIKLGASFAVGLVLALILPEELWNGLQSSMGRLFKWIIDWIT